MSDDCSYGMDVVNGLLSRFDMGDRWCFVDREGRYYGLSEREVEEVFQSADLFVDMGTNGSWLDEAQHSDL